VPAICGLLFLQVALLFGRTANYPFVNYDDPEYVYNNPHVTHGLNGRDAAWAFTAVRENNWHPLTWISHQLDWQIFGGWAGGHHLSSLVLHAGTAVLLFLVLRNMTARCWPAACVAAMFAVHPLRVESVVWVAERKDVLSGLFLMLILAAYGGYARRAFSWARYLAVIGLYALGLMCKPMLVSVPFLLLALDYWPLRRLSRSQPLDGPARLAAMGRLLAEKTPLLAMSAASSLVTIQAQRHAMASVASLSLGGRIGNALLSYTAYLGMALWPVNLAVYYPLSQGQVAAGAVAGAGLVLLAITAATLILRRGHPYLLMGWLWYLGMLLPVIGIVQVGSQSLADRYTYLPMIGPCIAVVWGASRLLAALPRLRRAACCGMAIVLACLTAATWRQTAFWRDSETLWARDIAVASGSAVAHINLGRCCYDAGRFAETIEHSRQALLLEPDNPRAHFNLGLVLDRQGRSAEAIQQYRLAVRADPGYAQAHHNLGFALYQSGSVAEAVEHYRRAVQADPDYAQAHFSLARALFNSGLTDEASEQYRQAVRLNPEYASAYNNLGNALLKLGHLDEATQQYRQAVRLEPDYAMAHYNLGLCLARSGRRGEALGHLEQSLRLADASGQKPLAEAVLAQIQRLREGKP
jgi:tetratricopeptide (TPR) repeat protein